MGKNTGRPQRRKDSRLGQRLVTRGMETGTYNGGYQTRTAVIRTPEQR